MGLHTPHRAIIADTFAAQERCDALMIVRESSGFPVAQAWLDFVDRGTFECPHFWAVRVFPPLEGAGPGSALMGVAENHAAEAGGRELELGVEPANLRARRFYERLGYRPVGSKPEIVRNGPDGEVVRYDPHQLLLRKPLRSGTRSAGQGG